MLHSEKVGVVVCSKTKNPGALIARWTYGIGYFGSGLATGGPIDNFEGNFHVRYFIEDGTFANEFDLEIVKADTFYEVTWRVDGAIKARGVGMLVDEEASLAVGWRAVNE